MYFVTTLSSYSDGTVTEVSRQLSVAQHESIERERANEARPKVIQRRVSFLWERQAFELHTDIEPAYGVDVLHRRSEVSRHNAVLCKVIDDVKTGVSCVLLAMCGVSASTSASTSD